MKSRWIRSALMLVVLTIYINATILVGSLLYNMLPAVMNGVVVGLGLPVGLGMVAMAVERRLFFIQDSIPAAGVCLFLLCISMWVFNSFSCGAFFSLIGAPVTTVAAAKSTARHAELKDATIVRIEGARLSTDSHGHFSRKGWRYTRTVDGIAHHHYAYPVVARSSKGANSSLYAYTRTTGDTPANISWTRKRKSLTALVIRDPYALRNCMEAIDTLKTSRKKTPICLTLFDGTPSQLVAASRNKTIGSVLFINGLLLGLSGVILLRRRGPELGSS